MHQQHWLDEYGDAVQEKNKDNLYHERLVKENRSRKENVHKQMESEEELEAAIEKDQGLVEERNQEICSLRDEREPLGRRRSRRAPRTRSERVPWKTPLTPHIAPFYGNSLSETRRYLSIE